MGYDDEHPEPVLHGDTVRAETTVTDEREPSDGERAVVTMAVEAFMQDDALMCSLEQTVLSPQRSTAECAVGFVTRSEALISRR